MISHLLGPLGELSLLFGNRLVPGGGGPVVPEVPSVSSAQMIGAWFAPDVQMSGGDVLMVPNRIEPAYPLIKRGVPPLEYDAERGCIVFEKGLNKPTLATDLAPAFGPLSPFLSGKGTVVHIAKITASPTSTGLAMELANSTQLTWFINAMPAIPVGQQPPVPANIQTLVSRSWNTNGQSASHWSAATWPDLAPRVIVARADSTTSGSATKWAVGTPPVSTASPTLGASRDARQLGIPIIAAPLGPTQIQTDQMVDMDWYGSILFRGAVTNAELDAIATWVATWLPEVVV